MCTKYRAPGTISRGRAVSVAAAAAIGGVGRAVSVPLSPRPQKLAPLSLSPMDRREDPYRTALPTSRLLMPTHARYKAEHGMVACRMRPA